MKILLSNDDGISAPGLRVLKEVLGSHHDITVVAPMTEKSASGHALTLKKDIIYKQVGEQEYAVDGFPADCVAMGLLGIMKHDPPDLVISGINRGGNLGQDSYYSGTVAAAREAVFRDIPGIALSLVTEYPNSDPSKDHFETAANFMLQLLEGDLMTLMEEHIIININVPNLPADQIAGSAIGCMGFRKRRLEIEPLGGVYRVKGGDQGYADIQGSDCQLISEAKISLSPLNVFLPLSDRYNAWRNKLDKL